jgi:hypothetical protein
MIHDTMLNVHKVKLDAFPPMNSSHFQINRNRYHTRNELMVLPKCNTVKYGCNSFKSHGASMYNKLPNDFKQLNVEDFRKCMKDWKPSCQCGTCTLCCLRF